MLQALVAVALGLPPDFQVTPVLLVALALLGDPAIALAVGEALAFAIGTPLARLATVVGTFALAQFGVTTLVGDSGPFAVPVARPLACKFTVAIGAPLGLATGLLATGLIPLFGLTTIRCATVLAPLLFDAGLLALLRPASAFRLFTSLGATRVGLALLGLTVPGLLLAGLRPLARLGHALLGLPAFGGLAGLASLLLPVLLSPGLLLSIVLFAGLMGSLLRLLPLGGLSSRIGGMALAFGIGFPLRLGALLAFVVGLLGATRLLFRLAGIVALVLVRSARGFARRGRCRQAECEQRRKRRGGEGSGYGCHGVCPLRECCMHALHAGRA